MWAHQLRKYLREACATSANIFASWLIAQSVHSNAVEKNRMLYTLLQVHNFDEYLPFILQYFVLPHAITNILHSSTAWRQL